MGVKHAKGANNVGKGGEKYAKVQTMGAKREKCAKCANNGGKGCKESKG